MMLYVTVATSGTRTYAVEVPDDTPTDNPEEVHYAVVIASDRWELIEKEVDLGDDEDLEITDDSQSRKRLWIKGEYDDAE